VDDWAWIYCYLLLSNKGSSTGAATVTGIPFAAASLGVETAPFQVRWQALATSIIDLRGFIASGQQVIQLRHMTAAATSAHAVATDNTNINNTTGLIFEGVYLTA
jgi:hypothetical protein